MDNTYSYVDAVRKSFDLLGISILNDPSRFLASLMDICDPNSPELMVLERNCDTQFLRPFAEAAFSEDPNSLEGAYARGCNLLTQDRFIESGVAASICSGITNPLRERMKRPVGSLIQPNGASKTMVMVDDNHDASIPTPIEVFNGKTDVTPQGENVSTQPKKRSKFSFIVILIIALSIVGAIAMFNSALVYTITFDGDGADAGTMADFSVTQGEPITLPSNPYTKKGFEFIGWQDEKYELYNPKEVYTPTEDTEFVAVWLPTECSLAFDGNGANDGSMDIVTTDFADDFTLPECGFKKDGFRFIGWRYNGESYEPGQNITVLEDITFKAEWDLDIEASLSVERFFKDTTDDGDLFIAVFIKNTSSESLRPHVDFCLLNEAGEELGKLESSSYGFVQPGETTMVFTTSSLLNDESSAKSATDATYELSIEGHGTVSDHPSLASKVSVNEVSKQYDKLEIELQNNNNENVYIGGVVAFAEAYSGGLNQGWRVQFAEVGDIPAGESKVVAFEREGWSAMGNIEYYFYEMV